MNTLQLAGSLPRDPQFREWVGQFALEVNVDAEFAASFIRAVCKVDSRKELETNPRAALRFHSLIRRQFIAWRDQQQSLMRAA